MVILCAAGCREAPPDSYVELTGKIFVFNYRVATATYVVTLGKLRPLPEGAVAETLFDDPSGGAPIAVKQKIWPKLDKISIESPPVFCIVKDRPYKFIIDIRGGDGDLLQKVEGAVVSSLNQSVLPAAPLVVGNGYDPNPALKGRMDDKLSSIFSKKCSGIL